MTEVVVKALIGFERSPSGDDKLQYAAGELYPFPADKLAAYVKAGRVELVKPDEEPVKKRKPKPKKEEEPEDGTA